MTRFSEKSIIDFSFIGGSRNISETKPVGHISRATLNSSTGRLEGLLGGKKAQVTSQAARSVIFKVHFSSLSFFLPSFKKSSRALSSNKNLYQTDKSGAAMTAWGRGTQNCHVCQWLPSPSVFPQAPPPMSPEHFQGTISEQLH